MLCVRFFITFFTLCFLIATPSLAADRINARTGELSIYRHGEKIDVLADDKKHIIKRIMRAFHDQEADTSELWYKQEIEKRGQSLSEKWNTFKKGSYFSVTYPNTEKNTKRYIPAKEMIITINEEDNSNLIGEALVILKDGEVRQYRIKSRKLVSLYCFDKAAKYLPSSYSILYDRYMSEPYIYSGISCDLESDKIVSHLEAQQIEKLKNKKKRRKHRSTRVRKPEIRQ